MDKNVNRILQEIANTAAVAADEAKAAARSAGKAVSSRYDVIKMNIDLVRLQSEQEELFSETGRILFMMHTGMAKDIVMTDDGEKSPQQAIDELLVQSEQLEQEMAVLEEKLGDVKNVKVCPKCGRICDEHNMFCAICGENLSPEEQA